MCLCPTRGTSILTLPTFEYVSKAWCPPISCSCLIKLMQRHYIGAQCIISWVTYVNFPMIIAHRRFIDATERNCTIFFDSSLPYCLQGDSSLEKFDLLVLIRTLNFPKFILNTIKYLQWKKYQSINVKSGNNDLHYSNNLQGRG